MEESEFLRTLEREINYLDRLRKGSIVKSKFFDSFISQRQQKKVSQYEEGKHAESRFPADNSKVDLQVALFLDQSLSELLQYQEMLLSASEQNRGATMRKVFQDVVTVIERVRLYTDACIFARDKELSVVQLGDVRRNRFISMDFFSCYDKVFRTNDSIPM